MAVILNLLRGLILNDLHHASSGVLSTSGPSSHLYTPLIGHCCGKKPLCK